MREPSPELRAYAAAQLAELGQQAKSELVFLRVLALDSHALVQDAAQKAGVKLLRAQTVGDHPLFLQMMADVIRKTAEACVPHP